MKPIIVELVDYLNDGQAGPLLRSLESELGSLKLREALIHLLEWLSRSAFNWFSFPPLHLDGHYPWCETIRQVVRSNNQIAEVFSVTDTELDFQDEVNWLERRRIRKFVMRNYRIDLFK